MTIHSIEHFLIAAIRCHDFVYEIIFHSVRFRHLGAIKLYLIPNAQHWKAAILQSVKYLTFKTIKMVGNDPGRVKTQNFKWYLKILKT